MKHHSWMQAGYKKLHCKKCGCEKITKNEFGRHVTTYEYMGQTAKYAPECSERFVAMPLRLW